MPDARPRDHRRRQDDAEGEGGPALWEQRCRARHQRCVIRQEACSGVLKRSLEGGCGSAALDTPGQTVTLKRTPVEAAVRTKDRRVRALLSIVTCGAVACAALAATLAGNTPAAAQTYPSRPITMIVPFPPGGATDAIARIINDRLRAALGQPVIIENVGGAGGSIGVGRAVRAPADGYTLNLGQLGSHVMNGAAYDLPYDLLSDLDPV